MRRFRRIVLVGAMAAGGGFVLTAAPADAYCHQTPQVAEDQPNPFDRDGNGCTDCPSSGLEKLGIEVYCLD